MIWLTWAPESEKVITVRGWLKEGGISSGSLRGDRLDEQLLQAGRDGEVDHGLDRVDTPRAAATSATVA